ncbi:MAG TPA: SIS domain-containing protein [Thermoplasmata archaeon]
MSSTRPEGLARMRTLATQVPEHLAVGFATAVGLSAPIPRQVRSAVVVGMGGSAIAADLARSVTDPELEIALEVGRGPSLPRSIDKSSLTIFTSYSGNTWETLSAYDEAGRRGSVRLAISSGGELARRAERDGVPYLQLPPGLPPRAAVGYLLGGLFGVLDPFFAESNDTRIRRAAARVAAMQASLGSPKGLPARLARSVGKRTPEIYADVSIASLARRWKTQIEENSKRLAHFDLFPELLHNAIVGWDAQDAAGARRWAVLLIDWPGQNPAIAPAVTYLERLLKRRGVVVARAHLGAEDRIEALVTGVSIGDHLSLYLAEAAGVDPYPVEAITLMKRSLDRS